MRLNQAQGRQREQLVLAAKPPKHTDLGGSQQVLEDVSEPRRSPTR